jgi:hypothetical protein
MTQHAATTPTSGRPDNLNAEQVTVVPNPGPHAYLPDVEFSPCGARYAVTEPDNNRVRLHDSATHAVLRTFEGMDAGLDYPHGLALGDRFLFVSNQGSSRAAPTSICCFGLDGVSSKPSSIVPTPDPRWREPHSLALRCQPRCHRSTPSFHQRLLPGSRRPQGCRRGRGARPCIRELCQRGAGTPTPQ